MKLVYQDAIAPSIIAEVETILDHKKIDEELYYLTKWKNQPSSLNQWVSNKDFHDLAPIKAYWKDKPSQNPKPTLYRKRKKNLEDIAIQQPIKLKLKVPQNRKSKRLRFSGKPDQIISSKGLSGMIDH